MNISENYIDINKTLWNEKTKHHIPSAFYDVDSFIAGRNSLPAIDIDLLGDVQNKLLLHLQCHFGQDTLSLARMGAKATGADLSDIAITEAGNLAQQLNIDARFVCSDIYSLPQNLNGQFDVVYTSYGVLGWLPDMKKWAEVVAHFLKPKGEFLLVEFHPAIWMFDNDFTKIEYSYFNKEVIVEVEDGTYADRNAPMKSKSVSWNHSLAEVLGNLMDAGLQITFFQEYDYSPWNCFNNAVETEKGKFMIKGMEGKLPLLYAVKAVKP